MSDSQVSFRRINGRLVPIRGGDKPAGKKPHTPHAGYKVAGHVAAIASGAVSAAGLAVGGWKTVLAAEVASHSIGLGGSALAVKSASYAKGGRNKAKAYLSQEVTNQALGWGTFGALVLANPTTRQKGINAVKTAVSFTSGIVRKVL